jgi:hypothetical protein
MSALVMIWAALKLGTVPTIPQSAIRVQQHGSDSGACQEGYYEVQKMPLRSLPGHSDAACPPTAYLSEGQIR